MYFGYFLVLFSICLPISGINEEPLREMKIIGGSPTRIENAPYMAFFMLDDEISCGGSILNKNQILTAAHCVRLAELNVSKIKVGSSFRDSFTQTFDAAELISHPKYDNKTFDYDAAVVTINGAFKFSRSVGPIALAGKYFDLPDRALVKITGWGYLNNTDDADYSYQLQEVTVPIVAQKTCIKEYANISVDITDNMVCAGVSEKGACHGDSGGPLTYEGKVAGIVSFSEGCALPGFPTVYTRVSAVRPWLDTVLKSDHLNTLEY